MSKPQKTILLKLLPEDIDLIFPQNIPLAEALNSAGINIHLPCGGAGICGKCKVRFLEGAPIAELQEEILLSPEEWKQGVRLACTAQLTHDCKLYLPDDLRLSPKAATDLLNQKFVEFNPPVKKIHLQIPLKALENVRSDLDLLLNKLSEVERDNHLLWDDQVLPKIPKALREQQGNLTVTLFENKIIDIESGDTSRSCYGMAIDLGTTTVGVLLVDLATGHTLDYAVFPNPQASFGADLISRISFASQSLENCLKLQAVIRLAIAEIVEKLCLQHQISPSNIYLTAIAGNTVMTHLFWGVSPQYVGIFPFTPVFSDRINRFNLQLNSGELSLPLVISLPLIGGFVGGDVIADMLVAEMSTDADTTLLIDIGTNCEVVLKHKDRLLATSAPAGPALEGANILHGMRAIPGALIHLQRKDDTIIYKSIDDAPPYGICGSGLFHIIHYLLEEQVIKEDGQIVEIHPDPFWNKRLTQVAETQPGILLVSKAEGALEDIYLTQQDIRNFQLANAAISSAWILLCRQRNLEPGQINKILIAGAFGSFIRPASLIALGTIPAIHEDRVQFIGNGSLEGVRELLINKNLLRIAEQLASRTELVELAEDPEFQEIFVENLKLTRRIN